MHFDTLDDAIGAWMASEDAPEIGEYLGQMPHTRASAEELLDAAGGYDCYEVYAALLTEFEDLLTDAEAAGIREKYRETFDMPLPGEADEN
ncbi:MAG: hypothetical protein K5695_07475 [Oscillospiraceae bacterium]|nr:hypothetical protein [Oscillospiraceae bacterium]